MDMLQFDYIVIKEYKLPHKLSQKSYKNLERAFIKTVRLTPHMSTPLLLENIPSFHHFHMDMFDHLASKCL
jgi:hypothetical protein